MLNDRWSNLGFVDLRSNLRARRRVVGRDDVLRMLFLRLGLRESLRIAGRVLMLGDGDRCIVDMPSHKRKGLM